MKKHIILSVLVLWSLFSVALAHPGRTDSKGGHYNHSTGEYHYHHGYPEHQHPNGICPYKTAANEVVTASATSMAAPASVASEKLFMGYYDSRDRTFIELATLVLLVLSFTAFKWTFLLNWVLFIAYILSAPILAMPLFGNNAAQFKTTYSIACLSLIVMILIVSNALLSARERGQRAEAERLKDIERQREEKIKAEDKATKQRKLALAEKDMQIKMARYEKQKLDWDTENKIKLQKAAADEDFQKNMREELLSTMKTLEQLLIEYRSMQLTAKPEAQLSMNDYAILEKEAQIKETEREILKKHKYVPPAVIANMPSDTVIGNDNLPREKNSKTKSDWGSKYTFWRSERGRVYHRTACQCNVSIKMHACHVPKDLSPCKLCNPSLPDLSWYKVYLEDMRFMLEMEQDINLTESEI